MTVRLCLLICLLPVLLVSAPQALLRSTAEEGETFLLPGIEGTGQSLLVPRDALLTAVALRLEPSSTEGPGSFRAGLWQIDTSALVPAPGGYSGARGTLLTSGRLDKAAIDGANWYTVTFTTAHFAAGGTLLYLQIEPEQPDTAGFNRFAFNEANPYPDGTAIAFRAPFDPTYFLELPQRDLAFVLYQEVPELLWGPGNPLRLLVPESLSRLEYSLYSTAPQDPSWPQWTLRMSSTGLDGTLEFSLDPTWPAEFYQLLVKPRTP